VPAPERREPMSWTSAIGLGARLEDAVAEAADQVGTAHAIGHDLAVAFVSAAYGTAVERLPQLLRPVVGDCLLLGCNAGGLIGGGSEEEDEPGIALLCGRLPDAVLAAVHLEQATLPPLTASRESWWRLLDVGPESEPSFLLLADPATIDAEACARGLDRAFPGSTVIGGLTAGMLAPGTARLVTGGEVHRTGAALLALSGNVVIDSVLAQGCRPIGDPLFVTACDGNLISELDGQRPREVLTALFSSLDEADRARFGDDLCIGLALPGPRQAVGAGDFLVRNVLGLDPDSGALWIGGRVTPAAIVQFHLRDGESASGELEQRLGAALAGQTPPAAALLFACAGRGRNLFGVSGHDSGTLRRMIDIPVAGMFSAGEIAPVQGATFVHGYSSVFGLIRPRAGRL
jgi:small ligand-binding sensory domain FIST